MGDTRGAGFGGFAAVAQAAACSSALFFIAAYYCILGIGDGLLFIHAAVDGHCGCFRFGALTSKVNILERASRDVGKSFEQRSDMITSDFPLSCPS